MSQPKKKRNLLLRLVFLLVKIVVVIALLAGIVFGYQKAIDYLDWRQEREVVRSHLKNTLPGYDLPLAEGFELPVLEGRADKSISYALPYRQTFNGIHFVNIKGDFIQTAARPEAAYAFSPFVLLAPPINIQGASGEVVVDLGSFAASTEIKPAAYGLENGSVEKLGGQSYDENSGTLRFRLRSSLTPVIAIVNENVTVQEYRQLKIVDPDDRSVTLEIMFYVKKGGNDLAKLPDLARRLTNTFRQGGKEELTISPLQALMLDQVFNTLIEKSLDVFSLPPVRKFGESIMETLGEDAGSFEDMDKEALAAMFQEQVIYKKGLKGGDILSPDVLRDEDWEQHEANADLKLIGEKEYSAGAVWDSGFSVFKDGFSFRNLGPAQSPGGICMGFSVIAEGVYNKFVGKDILRKQSIPGFLYQPGTYQYTYDLTNNSYDSVVKGNVIAYGLSDATATLLTDNDLSNDPSPPPLAEDIGSKDGPLLTALAGHWDKGNQKYFANIGGQARHDFTDIERLKELFEQKKVVTVGLAYKTPQGNLNGHAIVGYRLDQSADDPDRYWLYVYDNNNPYNRLFTPEGTYDGSNLLKIEIRKVLDPLVSQQTGEPRYTYEYDYLIYTNYGEGKNTPWSSSRYGGNLNFMYRFGSLAAAIPSPNPGPGKKTAVPVAAPVLAPPAAAPNQEPKQVKAGELSVGSYVQIGRYQGQPLLWQVIHLESGKATLFAHQVLPGKSFDAAGDNLGKARDPKGHVLRNGSNYWGQANIREWLNSKDPKVIYSSSPPAHPNVAGESYAQEAGFLTNFTENESQAMVPATRRTLLNWWDKAFHEGGSPARDVGAAAAKGEILAYREDIALAAEQYERALYQQFTDTVFLLSVQELHDYVYANQLPVQGTWLIGSSRGKTAPYWLSTPLQGAASTVRYVNSGSLILYEVAYGTMGIRPALVISTDGLAGAGTAANPYRVSP